MLPERKKNRPHTFSPHVINLLFVVGLLSAIAFRAIIILNHINPEMVRIVWYLGISGYILFFAYRYAIARKRRKVIRDYRLIEKIKDNPCMTEEDKEVTEYILFSIMRSREMFNYLILFILSVAAVLADQILVALKK